jgi:alginate O-acetyltransferase complex protein AlgI
VVFNSLTFLVFFALVLALHAMPLAWKAKKLNLLIASYVFYAAWNPPFVVLLWLSTLVDWWAAARLHRSERAMARRAWLAVSVVVNLGLLAYFKYGGFVLENLQASLAAAGIAYAPPDWSVVLPVGISFYTFQTMSYTLDVYLRRAAPSRSFLDFSLYVTFFPQLVAGPIVRPSELLPQFATPRRATSSQFAFGLGLMILGLFQKIVLADAFLAPAAEAVFDARPGTVPGALDAWIGTLAFGGQIFCDFAGYSTIAIGTGLCLGFALPDNFRFPYAAVGFSDFWRRWHITLSSWLRDYLYIPLGGNRHCDVRTYFALMATMLLGGLWHGASWTFVAWGGLHGLYLAVERALRKRFAGYVPGPLALFMLGLLTYVLVNITWVFFRAQSFPQAWGVLRGMFGLNGDARPILSTPHLGMAALIVFGIVAAHWLMRTRTLEAMVAKRHPAPIAVALGGMAFAVAAAQGQGNAFIYFQF